MTNRAYIESRNRIPAAIAALIQPSFSFDICTIPVIPDYIRGGWDWLSDGRAIYVAARHLRVVSTSSFIQGVSHELEHVRQLRELGIRWYLRIAGDVLRSLWKAHKLYVHALSRNEQEAIDKEREVWLRLLPSYETWKNLMDEECGQ